MRLPYLFALLLPACGPTRAPQDSDETTGEADTGRSEASSDPGQPNPSSPDPSSPDPSSPDPSSPDPTSPEPTTTLPTTVSTTNEPDPSTDSVGFLPAFDMGTHLECDIFAQDCPQGQKCGAFADGDVAWNSTRCFEVIGNGAPGDPCTVQPSGGDDCGFGSMCWDVQDDGQGTCVGQCTGSAEAPVCPEAHDCKVSSEGVLAVCLPWCDPLGDDCREGDLCLPLGDMFQCVVAAPGELAPINGACDSANSCAAGLLCHDSSQASAACDQDIIGCCTPFCELPNGACPNPDQACVEFFGQNSPPGFESVGFCRVPE